MFDFYVWVFLYGEIVSIGFGSVNKGFLLCEIMKVLCEVIGFDVFEMI